MCHFDSNDLRAMLTCNQVRESEVQGIAVEGARVHAYIASDAPGLGQILHSLRTVPVGSGSHGKYAESWTSH